MNSGDVVEKKVTEVEFEDLLGVFVAEVDEIMASRKKRRRRRNQETNAQHNTTHSDNSTRENKKSH